jgi:uncharacterized membrane protein (UPF0127 family)
VGAPDMRCWLTLAFVLSACSTLAESPFPAAEVEVGAEGLTVWVADESDERRQGLMDVDRLPEDIDGMLFAWPEPTAASFHMRNTLIPLDVWWFDESAVLLGGARMEPCLTEPCTSYGSPGPISWALETPAGGFDFEPGALLSTITTG